MGANAATKCFRIVKNLQNILAIEMLNAADSEEVRMELSTPTKAGLIKPTEKDDETPPGSLFSHHKLLNKPEGTRRRPFLQITRIALLPALP